MQVLRLPFLQLPVVAALELTWTYETLMFQIRVVQNKEPPHFMAMFDGKMVIFSVSSLGNERGESDKQVAGSCVLLYPIRMNKIKANIDNICLVVNPIQGSEKLEPMKRIVYW